MKYLKKILFGLTFIIIIYLIYIFLSKTFFYNLWRKPCNQSNGVHCPV